MTKIPLVNFCRSILKDSSHQIHFLKLKNVYFSLNFEPQKYSLGDTEFSYHMPQEYYYGKRVVEISQFTNINEDDFQEIMETAILFSKFESNVKIMPHITKSSKFEYDSEFGSLKGTPYHGKCPDLLINGNWYEFESFKTSNSKRAFKNMLNRGLKQSDRIIIKKPNNLSDHYMRKNIDFRIKNGQNITEIWLKESSNLRCFYKKHCNELLPSSYCVNHISYTTKSFIIRRSVKIG